MKCNHINKQYHNLENVLEDLACILEEGHSGNHKAEHEALREFSGAKNPNLTYKVWAGKEYQVVIVAGEWSEEAGRSAAEYAAELEEKRKKLEEFKKSNPGMAESHKQKARELGLIPANRA